MKKSYFRKQRGLCITGRKSLRKTGMELKKKKNSGLNILKHFPCGNSLRESKGL